MPNTPIIHVFMLPAVTAELSATAEVDEFLRDVADNAVILDCAPHHLREGIKQWPDDQHIRRKRVKEALKRLKSQHRLMPVTTTEVFACRDTWDPIRSDWAGVIGPALCRCGAACGQYHHQHPAVDYPGSVLRDQIRDAGHVLVGKHQ